MNDDFKLALATVGELELIRRKLVAELAARDDRIKELEALLEKSDDSE